MDCTNYVAKTKAQLICMFFVVVIFLHMQKACFLMTRLKLKWAKSGELSGLQTELITELHSPDL